MAKQDLRVPANPAELREFVSLQGYGVDDLLQVLELELNGPKRTYIALRIASRINKLRANKLKDYVIKRIANGLEK